MLTGLIVVLFFSLTSLVGGQTVPGNPTIAELHGLSYVYQGFTVSPLYKRGNPQQNSPIAVSWDIGSQ